LRAQPQLGLFVLLCGGHRLRLGLARHHPVEHRQPRLSASLCGQLIVSETLFALAYSFRLGRPLADPRAGAAVRAVHPRHPRLDQGPPMKLELPAAKKLCPP
jgi:hypothetical protein